MVGMSKSGSRYGRRSNWFKIHCLMQQTGSKSGSKVAGRKRKVPDSAAAADDDDDDDDEQQQEDEEEKEDGAAEVENNMGWTPLQDLNYYNPAVAQEMTNTYKRKEESEGEGVSL